jgi:serine/threonine protein kinase/AAA+ ATPase superfamily predicted ATPase/tetratricopeptide (TPR) repeat protein
LGAVDVSLDLGARFRIVREIGRGGMGVVYEVFDHEREERVALKTLQHMDPNSLLRFKNEFRILHDLHHPNLVSLGELAEMGGSWFFTMELVEGVDFTSFIGGDRSAMRAARATTMSVPDSAERIIPSSVRVFWKEGRPAAAPAVDFDRLRHALAQLTNGLLALHEAKRVHRDIKPSNILVTKEGRVVVLDFGLVADTSKPATDHTVAGTVLYMAPEQAEGRTAGAPADWYSVGVMLFEALTGQYPFDGEPFRVLMQKSATEAPSARDLAPEVPEDWCRLCTGLLRRDVQRRLGGRAVLDCCGVVDPLATTQSQPSMPPVFLGRDRELAMLRDALAQARDGQPIAVLLHGQSGVGKTTIVKHFLQNAAEEGVVVLEGRCYEREAVPYKAFDGVVDELSSFLLRDGAADLVPTHVGLLTQVFPVLRRIDSFVEGRISTKVDPQQLRTRAFAALRELFSKLAERRGLVIAIDDLQWTDKDSLVLLEELFGGRDAPPVLLVATVREMPEGEGHADLEELAGRIDIRTERLEITPLPKQDALEFARRLLGSTERRNAEAIFQETGGHPLLISELVRHRKVASGDGPAPSLDSAVWARAVKLTDAARGLLELVATAGFPVRHDVVAQALGTTFADIRRELTRLRGENLLRSTGLRSSDHLEVYHDRIREAVINHLDPDRVRHHHRRLAGALTAMGQADPMRLAMHWHGAGELGRAAEVYLEAARKAEEALAFESAARFYELGIELGKPDDAATAALQSKLADALANAGRGAEAAEWYVKAAAGSSPYEASDLRLRAAEQLLRSGRIDEGMGVVGTILSEIDISVPSGPWRALFSLVVWRLRLWLRGLGFRETPEKEIAPLALRRIDATWSMALSLGHVDPIFGAEVQTRNLIMALRAGEAQRVARALCAEAIFVASSGDSARKRSAKLLAAAEAIPRDRSTHTQAMIHSARGLRTYCLGQWPEAAEQTALAEKMFREQCVGAARELVTVQLFHLWALCYLGRVKEMSEKLPVWLREAEARSDRYAATSLRLGFINVIWLAKNDVDAARHEAEVAMGPWSHTGGIQYMDSLIALGQIDLYVGEPEAGWRRITAAWRDFERGFLLTVQVSRVEVLHLRGRSTLAVAARTPSLSSKLLVDTMRDVKRIRNEGLAWADPLADLLHAGVLVARGDEKAAIDRLDAAIDGFEASSMHLYAAVGKLRRAQLRGEIDGATDLREANAWFERQAIVDVGRMAGMLAPGFDKLKLPPRAGGSERTSPVRS